MNKLTLSWKSQSESLKLVQKTGGKLEKSVSDILQWDSGRVIYDVDKKYDLQVDNVFPNIKNPKIFASVTYTKPDTKGHSNENKLQLKVGELILFKNIYPESKYILILGGEKEAWLEYVLKAFNFFFDEVIYLWEVKGLNRLKEIKENPELIKKSHFNFWKKLKIDKKNVKYTNENKKIPSGLLRYKVLDKIKNQKPSVHHPDLIENKIASLCLHRAKIKNGAEWHNFLYKKWSAFEQSRSYFNPLEALIEISLQSAKLSFDGGIAKDVPVHSLLHDLGMHHTLLSEDFVLYSKKFKKDVFIQCKASGGGRNQHGKNIQNRTKEQVSRGIFYRCTYKDKELILNQKNFIWISILDGDWGVTKKTPHKYIHMLEFAGYDKYFCAEDLVDSNLNPLPPSSNPFLTYLVDELDCKIK
jgi:hypothetical protein